MNILSKSVGFMAVFCACGVANAALRAGGASGSTTTSRVSVATTPGAVTAVAARRIPTMTLPTSSSTATTTTAALMAQKECVDSYTECIRGADACGSDFEECTTNELFYAQMPKCNSVLMQCASAGVSALFGTSSMTALTVQNADSYPAAGSMIGQYIEASAISNRLDTGKCIQKYTSCLHKDDVCGEDFELCTSSTEFKKQKVFCESTLARCQDEGKTELFGSTDTTNYAAGSRLDIMITEGADLAAANAVSTCYKVADNCILSTCTANPFQCIAGTNKYLMELASEDGDKGAQNQSFASSDLVTNKEIMTHMRNACFDTIGGNKFCYMTVNGGKAPTASQLRDQDNRDDVFQTIYTLRKNAVADKLADLRDKFDKQAKDKCRQTIANCVVRTCGDGSGPACYELAFKTSNVLSVNNPRTRPIIKAGCELIVNADTNCQYAAASVKSGYDYVYAYDYNGNGTFDYLFPERTLRDDTNDPINVVAALNQSLQENYSTAAINDLGKRCKKTVESCIRNMCGTDFAKCYRNRSDIMGDTYSVTSSGTESTNTQGTWNKNFMNSMNKVSGILDFTIIRGLCASAVKDSKDCEEHLQIQVVKMGS